MSFGYPERHADGWENQLGSPDRRKWNEVDQRIGQRINASRHFDTDTRFARAGRSENGHQSNSRLCQAALQIGDLTLTTAQHIRGHWHPRTGCLEGRRATVLQHVAVACRWCWTH